MAVEELAEAKVSLQTYLGAQPDSAEALFLLGMVFQRQGDLNLALKNMQKATNLPGASAKMQAHLGLLLQQLGRYEESLKALRIAEHELADSPILLRALCETLSKLGQFQEVADIYSRRFPKNELTATDCCMCAVAYMDIRRPDQCFKILEYAGCRFPFDPQVTAQLAWFLFDLGYHGALIGVLKGGEPAPILTAIGYYQLKEIDRTNAYQAALKLIDHSLSVDPDNTDAVLLRAKILIETLEFTEAVDILRQIIRTEPDNKEAYGLLGYCHSRAGNNEESIKALRKALKLAPDSNQHQLNLAMGFLRLGRFQDGLPLYEARKAGTLYNFPSLGLQPLWDGRPFPEKTLLILHEQGFGDTINFIRFIPTIRKMGGTVIVECRNELRSLLEASFPDFQFSEWNQPQPDHDYQIPLLSLLRILDITPESIPAEVPYLQAPRKRPLLPKLKDKLSVGIVVQGGKIFRLEDLRQVPVAHLTPLFELSHCQFFSLHYPAVPPELVKIHPEIIDTAPWINDFKDEATIISELDLVISTCTATLHLAGALGVPTWAILPHPADWRWLLDRNDSPWYPTMRLFRQSRVGSWDQVIAELTSALREFIPIRSSKDKITQ